MNPDFFLYNFMFQFKYNCMLIIKVDVHKQIAHLNIDTLSVYRKVI